MLAVGAEPALAQFDAVCPAAWPIRLTGAACSGPNVGFVTKRPDGVAVCCAAPPRNANIHNGPTTYYGGPSQANRIAAGMALGAAGLEIVGMLVDMLGGPSQPNPVFDEEYERISRKVDADRAKAAFEAEQLNAGGLRAAQAGQYLTALGDFKRAADRDPSNAQYERNMSAMDALLLLLQEALALTAEKKFSPAFTTFAKASARARDGERPDIAQRIDAYRQQLLGQLEKAPAGVRETVKPTTNCVQVNGEFVCD
jgi:hypothetical protein